MNIVFLTIGSFNSIEDHSIYTDLLRTFRNNGHDIYVVCANEKREGKPTEFLHESGIHLLRVKSGTVSIGENTWIGAGATVVNNVDICPDCLIGAGAVVVKTIREPGKYIGVPARIK
ncbi:MAG: hypothetical protein E7651_00590 [Ruminococcaceae bacterium]|nr:hypothetical protein [Oscillospiraceae bacterium]